MIHDVRAKEENGTIPFEVLRTNQFPEAPITVFFTIRQYWARQTGRTFVEAYQSQRKICQDLVEQHVIPAVLKPLSQSIENKR